MNEEQDVNIDFAADAIAREIAKRWPGYRQCSLDEFSQSAKAEAVIQVFGKPAFQPGDLVRLKSGGPLMTVADLVSGHVLCGWFDNNKICFDAFPPATLVKADAPASNTTEIQSAYAKIVRNVEDLCHKPDDFLPGEDD